MKAAEPKYEPLQLDSQQPSGSRLTRTSGWQLALVVLFGAFVGGFATFALVFGSANKHNLEVLPDNSPASKRGAGLLLISGSQVLLLLRNSKNNNNTWGLPGGNVEAGDADLLMTAKREAEEEMGSVPEAAFVDQVLTRRGKHGKKHYTVFIGKLSADAKSGFQPRLNNEHSQWKWFELNDAMQQSNLHPVVELMFADPHKQQLVKAVGS